MNPRLFLISLLAISFSVHLLRFPHLVLENGGGAFFILYFICLNLVALPVLLAERVLNEKLHQQNFDQFIILKKTTSLLNFINRFSFLLMNTLKIIFLLALFFFFLYIGGVSFLFMTFFGSSVFGFTVNVTDVVNLPQMQLSFFGSLIWSTLTFLTLFFYEKKFIVVSCRYLLLFCYAIIIFLFLKVIISVTDYEGFKILLYPDFSDLGYKSLLLAIGHSLVSLLVGLGFYNYSFFYRTPTDPIELFIRSLVQVLLLSLFIGILALPMIQEVSETPFGSNWIFEILPRWLAYGEYGQYYSLLFFFALSFIGFFVTVSILTRIESASIKRKYDSKKPFLKVFLLLLFILFSATILFFMQGQLMGWSGQSLLLEYDFILVNLFLPLIALIILILVFQFTSRSEREAVFNQQKVFFHNQVFFKIWQFTALYVTPLILVCAFILFLMDIA